MARAHTSAFKHIVNAQGAEVESHPAPTEPKIDAEKIQLAEEVAALKLEVKKWKSEAEDAKCVQRTMLDDSGITISSVFVSEYPVAAGHWQGRCMEIHNLLQSPKQRTWPKRCRPANMLRLNDCSYCRRHLPVTALQLAAHTAVIP